MGIQVCRWVLPVIAASIIVFLNTGASLAHDQCAASVEDSRAVGKIDPSLANRTVLPVAHQHTLQEERNCKAKCVAKYTRSGAPNDPYREVGCRAGCEFMVEETYKRDHHDRTFCN